MQGVSACSTRQAPSGHVMAPLTARVFVAAALIATASSASAADAQTCQPGISTAFGAHSAQYQTLLGALLPEAVTLTSQLAAVVDVATYDTLLAHANAVAAGTPNGRLVITLSDGTVVIDTARDDHTADPTSNSYQHFLDKTINENYNTRVAILASQEYPCGVGLESRHNAQAGGNEAFFAVRAGTHLSSSGTLLISSVEANVAIVDFAFQPSTLTVPVGTTVMWQYTTGTSMHSTTSNSAAWDSGLLSPGQNFSFQFTSPGTYDYHCKVHAFMTGTIVVN